MHSSARYACSVNFWSFDAFTEKHVMMTWLIKGTLMAMPSNPKRAEKAISQMPHNYWIDVRLWQRTLGLVFRQCQDTLCRHENGDGLKAST